MKQLNYPMKPKKINNNCNRSWIKFLNNIIKLC